MRLIDTIKQPKKVDMSTVGKLTGKISDLCRRYDISLFYIYGSLSNDKMKTLSDIDIAIMPPTRKYSLEVFLDITNKLQTIFGREDIDIVELDKASPSLRMHILTEGKLIYSRSMSDKANFRFKTISDYLSTNNLRKNFYEYLRRAVSSSG